MNTTNSGKRYNAARAAFSLLLSLSLTLGLCPSISYADQTSDDSENAVAQATVNTANMSSATSDVATDIADQWEQGGVTLTEPGTYIVSRDIVVDSTLFIASPRDEKIILDLQGHSVEVVGAVSSGIDLGASAGAVEITGSSSASARGSLSVSAYDIASSVCGIQANFAEQENHANGWAAPQLSVVNLDVEVNALSAKAVSSQTTVDAYGMFIGYADGDDARKSPIVSIADCSISSAISNLDSSNGETSKNLSLYGGAAIEADSSGVSYGIYSKSDNTSIDGAFASKVASAGLSCGLYSDKAISFSFGENFSLSNEMSVSVNANEGAFATVSNSSYFTEDVLKKFIDASGSGLGCSIEGNSLGFIPATMSKESGQSSPKAIDSEVEGNASDVSDSQGMESVEDQTEAVNGATSISEADEDLVASVLSLDTVENEIMLLAEESSGDEPQSFNDYAAASSSENYTFDNETARFKLTDDLSTTKAIVLLNNADVSLDLNGKTLVMGKTLEADTVNIDDLGSSKVRANAGTKFTLTDSSEGHTGKLVFLNDRVLSLDFVGATLVMDGVTVERGFGKSAIGDGTITIASGSNSNFGYLYGLIADDEYTNNSSFDVKNSNLTLDYSNLSAHYNAAANGRAATVVLSAANPSGKASFENTSITCIAAKNATLSNSTQSAQGGTAAKGVSAAAVAFKGKNKNIQATFNNCSFKAVSYTDKAFGVTENSYLTSPYAATNSSPIRNTLKDQAVITGNTTVDVSTNSGDVAVGLESVGGTNKKANYGISIDGSLTSRVTSSNSDALVADLYCASYKYNNVGVAFKIGSQFSGNALRVYLGNAAHLNAKGSQIAYAKDWNGDAFATFVDATGNKAVKLEKSGNYLVFAVDKENAQACLVHSDGSTTDNDYYGSLASAVIAAKSGDTVKILNDLGSLDAEIPETSEEGTSTDKQSLSYTLDLNGHTINSLTCSSAANWTIKNVNGALTGLDLGRSYASVVQNGAGTLTLEGAEISPKASNKPTYGVYASAGTVALKNCSVSVTPRGNDGRGVYAANANVSMVGGSITVNQGFEKAAYGIVATQSSASGAGVVNVSEGAAIKVTGIGNDQVGISAANGGSITDSSVSVVVESDSSGTNAYALVNYTGAFSVSGSSLSAVAEDGLDASNNAYWCLYGGKSEATFGLSGKNSFVSANDTHVYHDGAALVIDPSATFSNQSGESATLNVESVNLSQTNVFATVLEGAENSSLSGMESSFAPIGDEYSGWEVSCLDDGSLAWHTDNKVKIGDVTYRSLLAAYSAANEGDTLVLIDDLSSSMLTVEKPITIDLNGHAAKISSATYSIVSKINEGVLAIKDSKAGGSLVLGGKSGGINVTGAGDLEISDCSVGAVGIGINMAPSVIGGNMGAISLKNAQLSVGSSSGSVVSLPLVGATLVPSSDSNTGRVIGVQVGSTQAASAKKGSVSVDASSSITVSNGHSFGIENKTIASEMINGTYGKGSTLRKIEPDVNGGVYKAISDAFYKQAAFDDGSKSCYGIYYVTDMKVDTDGDGVNDMVVAAFSDQVSSDGIGKKDSIKPAAIYEYCSYQSSPDAVAVSTSGSTVTADVSISGTVSAVSLLGNAYGIEPSGSGTWTVTNAKVFTETKGTSAYQKDTDVVPDLNAELETSASVDFKKYFESYDITEVVEAMPEAGGVRVAAALSTHPSVVVSGALDFSSVAASSDSATYGIAADEVTVGSGLSLQDGSSAVQMKTRTGYAEEGKVFAKAAEGITLGSAQASVFHDAQGTYASVADTSANALIWSNSAYTVQFVDQYGNELLKHENVKPGESVVLPAVQDMTREDSSDGSYEFVGWSTSSAGSISDGDFVAKDAGSLILGSSGKDGVVTYYPVFSEIYNQLSVSFRGAYSSDGSALAVAKGKLESGQTVSSSIEKGLVTVPNAQSFTDDDGTRHVFVGWNDGTYVYGKDTFANMSFSSAKLFHAEYIDVSTDQFLVTFKVGCRVVSKAFKSAVTPTYTQQIGEQGAPKLLGNGKEPGQESKYSYDFLGWRNGDQSDFVGTPDYTTADSLPAVSADAVYTATFNKSANTVKVTLNARNSSGDYVPLGDPANNYEFSFLYGSGTKFSDLHSQTDVADYVKDDIRYEFVGWSTRSTDKDSAMYKDDDVVPGAGSNDLSTRQGTYYAVYKASELTADVTVTAGSSSVTLSGQKASTTLDEILSAAKEAGLVRDVPAGYSESWNDGKNNLNNSTLKLSAMNGADSGKVSLTQVLTQDAKPVVTIHWQNGATDNKVSVSVGSTLKDAGWLDSYTNPYRLGYSFNGWNLSADGTGQVFDIYNSKVVSDMDIYAQWNALSADCAEASSVSLDKAYVTEEAAVGTSVKATLAEAKEASSALSSLLTYDVASKPYKFNLSYEKNGETSYITDGFGTVSITLPVDSSWKEHPITIYYLDKDGNPVKKTLVTEADNKDGVTSVTFDLAGYSLSGDNGNLLLVRSRNNLEENKQNCREALQNAFNGYSESDYEDFENTIEKAYNDALTKVSAAESAEEAVAAANEGINAMKAVTSISAMNSAKADALARLADAYSGYDSSKYTSQEWASLAAAYDAAKVAVQSSKTVEAAGAAASTGIMAMNAITGTAGSNSSSGANSGSGSSGTTNGSGSSSGLKSTTGTGLTSTSGSGLSSTSGSGLSSTSGSGLSNTSGSNGLGGSSLSGNIASAIGATLSAVDDSMAQEKNLSVSSGLYVESVEDGGLAQGAGIEVGDVITAVDGTPVSSLEDLQSILEGKSAGDSVTFTVNRNGEELTLDGTLTEDVGDLSAVLDSGLESSLDSNADSGNSFLDWVKANLVIALILLLLLLGLIGLLIWWLLRRRNSSIYASDAPAEDAEDASSNASGGIGF